MVKRPYVLAFALLFVAGLSVITPSAWFRGEAWAQSPESLVGRVQILEEAVTALQNNLAAETAARASADAAEAAARQAAVNAEAAARASADAALVAGGQAAHAALQAAIDAETAARQAAVQAEVTARTNADAALQAALTHGGPFVLTDLQGSYAFTLTRVCVQANTAGQVFGASADGFPVPPGGATTRTSTFEGVFTYNGNGTGSATGTEFQIFHNSISPGNFPVAQVSFTADLPYTVNSDGSFTQQFENVTATALTGGIVPVGTIFGSTGTKFEGQIAPNKQILLLADVSANRETLSRTVGLTVFTIYRLCGRSGMAVKMPE